jgi:hypothetical protein
MNRILSGVLTRKELGRTETVGVGTADRILFIIISVSDAWCSFFRYKPTIHSVATINTTPLIVTNPILLVP